MLLIYSVLFIVQILVSNAASTQKDDFLSDLYEITKPIYINIDHILYPSEIPEENKFNENLACGKRGASFMGKIVGGISAFSSEFPWQVSLQLQTGMSLRHICGGTVVDKSWVATAGHCVFDIAPRALSIVAGDQDLYIREGGEQRRQVKQIFFRGFNESTFANDIALLKLDKPLKFEHNSKVGPICLPNENDSFKGTGIISGWGRLTEEGDSPNILQHVTLPIIEKRSCFNTYLGSGFSRFLNQCQMCAAALGKDACQGDSGGPLICKKNDLYYLCGIVSWGIGCARPQYPGVYTDITCYVKWMKQVMEQK